MTVLDYSSKKSDKYTSGTITNELLQIMALKILRGIAESLQHRVWYTNMADEVTDSSNREQLIIRLS